MVSFKIIIVLSFFLSRKQNDCKINNKDCPNTQRAPPAVTNVFKIQNTNTSHKKHLNTKYTNKMYLN